MAFESQEGTAVCWEHSFNLLYGCELQSMMFRSHRRPGNFPTHARAPLLCRVSTTLGD